MNTAFCALSIWLLILALVRRRKGSTRKREDSNVPVEIFTDFHSFRKTWNQHILSERNSVSVYIFTAVAIILVYNVIYIYVQYEIIVFAILTNNDCTDNRSQSYYMAQFSCFNIGRRAAKNVIYLKSVDSSVFVFKEKKVN